MDPLILTSIFKVAQGLLDRLFPDPEKKAAAQLELLKLQQSGELAKMASETDLAKAQLAINQAEAQNPSLFVSGWRPAIGWVCGLALTYQFVLRPVVASVAAAAGHPVPNLPGLDDTLWQLLFGMLGLGTLRTAEKIRGVAAK
ncbi:MAG TPA: holin family protein [Burkholderiales bacterium]|nr:holin family protein [Burkholderiales bacterium]